MPAAAALLQQLNASSTPYVDPLAVLQWENVATDAWWLPPGALSLAGVPEFERLPIVVRRRLSHLEFALVLETGLWLESLFMERFARASDREADPVLRARYLHEIREEAGHSLMFLELLRRSGVRVAAEAHPRSGLASVFGRLLPLPGALFWTLTVIGEELGDSLTRTVPPGTEDATISAVVYHMAQIHVREEARHIAHTRTACAEAVQRLSRSRRAALSPLIRVILERFANRLYYPRATFYASAGLPAGVDWRGLARESVSRRKFVTRATRSTRQFLRAIGWNVSSH